MAFNTDANDVARRVTNAALRRLDKEVPGADQSSGPLGDALAFALHNLVEEAVKAHFGQTDE